MAQYQRFLSYLFEYEGDQKKENCGFAKIEIRGDVQRIFLSVKNNEQAEILHVFGFYHTKDGCDCVPLGRMVVKNGKGQLQYINNGVYLAGSEIKSVYAIAGNYRNREVAEEYPDYYDSVVMSPRFRDSWASLDRSRFQTLMQLSGMTSILDSHCLRRIEQNKQHSLKMNRFWKISLRKNFKRWKFAVRLIAKKQTK